MTQSPEERAREIVNSDIFTCDGDLYGVGFERLETAIAAAIREAQLESYERAAKVADDIAAPYNDEFKRSNDHEVGCMAVGAEEVATAIRALKGET